jgi:hypothetical protein
VGGIERFVGYYENSGEFIGHYVAWLREWAAERRACFGGHFIRMTATGEPVAGGRHQGGDELARVPSHDRGAAEEQARGDRGGAGAFARCQFDEAACGLGLRRLRAYRKEWDEGRGCGRTGPATTRPRTGRMPSSPSPAPIHAALASPDQENGT